MLGRLRAGSTSYPLYCSDCGENVNILLRLPLKCGLIFFPLPIVKARLGRQCWTTGRPGPKRGPAQIGRLGRRLASLGPGMLYNHVT